MKKYSLIGFLFLIVVFVNCVLSVSAQPISQSSLVKFVSALPSPNVCNSNNRAEALIFVKNDKQYKCVGGTYIPAEGSSVAGVSSVSGRTGAITLIPSDIPNLTTDKTTSGVFLPDRLGSGTRDGTKFLRDDGTWATPSGNSSFPTQTRVANNQAGGDLGAKINAADAACGVNVGCEIWVLDGGSQAANTISTQVVIGSYHTLRFFAGEFYCNYMAAGNIGVILLKDNSSLLGDDKKTIIYENNDPNVQTYNSVTGVSTARTALYRIVTSFNNTLSGGTEFLSNTRRSHNITVSGIQFKGIRTNQHDGGVAGAITFGNCFGCSIRNCWFNEIAGYAAVFGGTSDGTDGNNEGDNGTNPGGNHSQDNWFTDNLMSNLQSQYLAVINSQNVFIERNIFREPGKRPYIISSVSNTNGSPVVVTLTENHHLYGGATVRLRGVTATGGATAISSSTDYFVKPNTPNSFIIVSSTTNTGTVPDPIYITPILGTGVGTYNVAGAKVDYRGIFLAGIDFEPNGDDLERGFNINIENNIFDFSITNGIFTTAILYQITDPLIQNANGKIRNNTIIGNQTGTGGLSIGIHIAYADTNQTDVSFNKLHCGSGNNIGILLSGNYLTADTNTLINCGGGGSGSIQSSSMTYSSVSNNTILNPNFGKSSVIERGVSNNNRWTNNRVTEHLHDATSIVTNSIYENNYWVNTANSGFFENTNSNNNFYRGNVTMPKLVGSGNSGLTIIGIGSKVLSHHYTDGRTFITNLNGVDTPFTNPN